MTIKFSIEKVLSKVGFFGDHKLKKGKLQGLFACQKCSVITNLYITLTS